jgi:hypothetical protein
LEIERGKREVRAHKEDTRRKKTKKEMADTKEKFVRTYGGGQTREKKVVGERTDTRERKKADTHG